MPNEVVEGEIVAESEEKLPGIPPELKFEAQRRSRNPLTVEKLQNFLVMYEKTALLGESARASAIELTTINRLRKEDPEFESWVQEALEFYRESLIREAHRRAIEGWDEAVFSQRLGTQMGVVRKYDSRLLELLLKRHIPEFREKFEGHINITGGVLVAPLAPTTAEDWEKKYGGDNQIKLLSTEQPGTTAPEQANVNVSTPGT